MLVKKKTLIFVFISVILLIYTYLGVMYNINNFNYFRFSAFFILALDILLAIKNRKNIYLFFLYIVITYFNFSFLYDLYILDKPTLIGFYEQFSNNTILGKGIYIVLLFTIILFLMDIFTKTNQSKLELDTIITSKNTNMYIAWAMCILEMFSIPISQIFGLPQVFEYSCMFIVLAAYYSGRDKILCNLVFVVSIAFFIYGNLTGTRIGVLSFLILAVFLFYGDKINWIKLLVCFFIGVIVMTYSGIWTDTGGKAVMSDAINKLLRSGFVLDTSQFSYMSSQIGVKVADNFLYTGEKLNLFKQFIISQFLGSRAVENPKMCLFTRDYYTHFNGQYFAHTFYFYLGWFGVIISGIIVGFYLKCIKSLNRRTKGYKKVLSIWCVGMVGKWYLYEPNALLRGSIILLCFFAFCEFLDKKVLKKNGYKK